MATTIKTGSTGRRPVVTEWIWRGTAEVLVFGFQRLPAAWAMTDSGKHAAIIEYDGGWWDARCIPCREWEHDDGELISGDLARDIGGFLRQTNVHHERAARRLNELAAEHYETGS